MRRGRRRRETCGPCAPVPPEVGPGCKNAPTGRDLSAHEGGNAELRLFLLSLLSPPPLPAKPWPHRLSDPPSQPGTRRSLGCSLQLRAVVFSSCSFSLCSVLPPFLPPKRSPRVPGLPPLRMPYWPLQPGGVTPRRTSHLSLSGFSRGDRLYPLGPSLQLPKAALMHGIPPHTTLSRLSECVC